MRLTRDYPGPAISVGGEFTAAIAAAVMKFRPRFVLETGTHLGLGSTRAICEVLDGSADFRTVECGRESYLCAVENLKSFPVKCYHALSIPRHLLPTLEQIELRVCGPGDTCGDVWVDHPEPVRAMRYFSETQTDDGVPDDFIGGTLLEWGGRCDFALLDSAGHIGLLEFEYFVSRLKSDCVIALDDTNHIKHAASLKLAKQDGRFTVLDEGQEKFGWAIIRLSLATRR